MFVLDSSEHLSWRMMWNSNFGQTNMSEERVYGIIVCLIAVAKTPMAEDISDTIPVVSSLQATLFQAVDGGIDFFEQFRCNHFWILPKCFAVYVQEAIP